MRVVDKADRDVRVVQSGPGVTILLPGLSEKAGATLLAQRFPPAFFPIAGEGKAIHCDERGYGVILKAEVITSYIPQST